MVMRIRFRQNALDLGHGNHGKETDKEQKESKKDTECANEREHIDPGGGIDPPGRRQEIPMKRNDKDDEALKPHPGVGTHRDKEDSHPIPAKRANPKQLWHDHVASEHRPRETPIWTKITIQEREPFEWVRSVESN